MRVLVSVFMLLVCVPQLASAQAPSTGSPNEERAKAFSEALEVAVTAYQEGRFPDALSQAESIASRGSPRAATLAGLILERGLAGSASPEAAVRWYRRSATGGDTDGMLGLARLGMQRKGGATPAEALAALQRAVGLGRTDAATSLADLFMSGAAGPRDLNRAASLYARAAAAGDDDAAYAAGILYADGDPDPVDDPLKAIAFLRQAAEAGRADAAADYGLMLYQGKGVARDLVAAAKWFKTAADLGDKDGAFYWALVCAKGEGTPRDIPLALGWARQARGSSPEADALLAQLERATIQQPASTLTPAPATDAKTPR